MSWFNSFTVSTRRFSFPLPADDRWVESVVKYELIPLLEEYWFDAPSKARQWSERLKGAVHD